MINKVSAPKSITTTAKPSFVLTAQEIVSLNISKVPTLVAPFLPKEGVGFFCGSSDTGKSYFLIFLALTICSSEKTMLGFEIDRTHSSALVVCTEEAMEDICVRLTGLLKEREIDTKRLRFIFETENLLQKLEQELQREPADLVIIDTFGDLFTGTLNDSISVRGYIKNYKDLARKFDCLILFNHHIGKGKEKNSSPSKNDVLGSQGIESAARVVFDLRKTDNGRRILTVVKGNYIADSEKNRGIVMGFDPERGFWRIEESNEGSSQSNIESAAVIEEMVMQYYDKYGNVRSVAEELTKTGYKIGKTKVSEIVKKHRPSAQIP